MDYFSTFCSHLNQKTQFENPVEEAKRKKQLGQADTGSSKPGRTCSSIFSSKNNLFKKNNKKDNLWYLYTELIKVSLNFLLLGLWNSTECLTFVTVKVGLILMKHQNILRIPRFFFSCCLLYRKYEIVGRRDWISLLWVSGFDLKIAVSSCLRPGQHYIHYEPLPI